MDANVFSLSNKEQTSSADRTEIMTELRAVICELNRAYVNFNAALEPDLIESCIYEINSLQSRYAWLLKSARECGLTDVEVFHFPKKGDNEGGK